MESHLDLEILPPSDFPKNDEGAVAVARIANATIQSLRDDLAAAEKIIEATRENEEAHREYLYGDEIIGDDMAERKRVLARAATAQSGLRVALAAWDARRRT